MNFNEIARRLDRSPGNECYVDVMDIASELGIDLDYAEQERLKAYWVGNWYCTDTYVGYRMYYLDNEPVCFSIQKGRKCDEEFRWFSEEAAQKVQEYLLSLVVKEDDELNIDLLDSDQDVGDSFKIQFSGQMLKSDNALYQSKPVKILERIRHSAYGIDTLLKIELADGSTKEVDIKELDFRFYIL